MSAHSNAASGRDGRGVVSEWLDDSVAKIEYGPSPKEAVLIGNRQGLRSLAKHLLTVAESAPDGSHLDFDEYCGWFADGSIALRIELDETLTFGGT